MTITKPQVNATHIVINITTYEFPVLAVVATLVFPVAFELPVAAPDPDVAVVFEAAPVSDGA